MKATRILFLLPLLCFSGVIIAGWGYWYAPLNCDQLIDRRLSSLLEGTLTESELHHRIANIYGLDLEDIRKSRLSDDNADWMYWSIGNSSYSAMHQHGQVVAVNFFQNGFLARKFFMEDIVSCFGEPDYAHAVWIPFEVSYTHYALWYPNNGIVFHGSIATRKLELGTAINGSSFNRYTLFRSVPLAEAVTTVYPGRNESDTQRLFDYIQPWKGSWDTIKINEE